MTRLEELRAKVLKNPESQAAYSEEKTLLAKEVAEWELEKQQAKATAAALPGNR
jgi:hypothetical protein